MAYIRVSKVGNREEIIGPLLQLDSIESHANRNGVRIVDVVHDIDRSGRTFRKRSVDGIIARIERGEVRRIVLWKWSRWARNVAESTKYLGLVRLAGGRVNSATEDLDQETAIGRLQLDITMRIDQYTSEVMSETWDAIHSRRRGDGLPHDGRPRFGYKYVEQEVEVDGEKAKRDRYVPDPNVGKVLKQAYVDYADKKSFDVIATAFNAAGLRTTLGGPWTAQGVARMMDTGFAAGFIRERSKPSETPANSINSYDVWRIGSHVPLIDQELWDAYRLRRSEQANVPSRSKRAVHELSALLHCGLCGRRLTTHYGGIGRTHQWHCAWAKPFHPSRSVSVANKLALPVIRGWVADMAGVSDVDMRAAQELEEIKGSGTATERNDLGDQVKRWRRKLSKLADLHTDDEIDRETYRERKAQYEAGLAHAQRRLNELPPPRSDWPDLDVFRTLDEEWQGWEKGERHDALATLVGAVVVHPVSASSSRKSASGRIEVIGRWEAERLARMQRAT